jgi:dTDP-4-dehydrorhamnose reductase
VVRDILITGGSGQVGTELARFDWPEGWCATVLTRAELDLSDPAAIAAKVAGRRWAAVINAAAYTAVDKAETEQVSAWQVNALAPAAMASACAKAGIPIVQVSTDYVFAGDREGAWQPEDPVAPLGVYGASKLGGELAVRSSGARHAIVRTAWVVSAHGSNFVKTMLRVGGQRERLTIVADQHGSPTSAADLAGALAVIAMRLAEDPGAASGTWHFSNIGPTTWHGFATEIFAQAARRGGPAPAVDAIPTSAYPTPARRPANSLLDTATLMRDFGIAPRPWRAALSDILDELMGTPQ